jgi:chromosome segregation ATPase
VLERIELNGFKSFGKKAQLIFPTAISAVVGPNGSGKSNVAEAFRFVLGEQSMKALRGRKGEDLIWAGSTAVARSNRAAVKLVFDNTKRVLDIDFPEVVIERIVHRDGQNEYLINETQVRLKDVMQLLASAHIGGTGYHIISQGQADTMVSASVRERRAMLEDALGLKLYQFKKIDAERSLRETITNLEKVRSLRREMAPHLLFLRKQVEKYEKGAVYKEQLLQEGREYIAQEKAYLEYLGSELQERVGQVTARRDDADARLIQARSSAQRWEGPEQVVLQNELKRVESAQQDIMRTITQSEREIGRLEGSLEATTSVLKGTVPAQHVFETVTEVLEELEVVARSPDAVAVRLMQLHARLAAFLKTLGEHPLQPDTTAISERIQELSKALNLAQKELQEGAEVVQNVQSKVHHICQESREVAHVIDSLERERQECERALRLTDSDAGQHKRRSDALTQTASDLAYMVGTSVLRTDEVVVSLGDHEVSAQEQRLRSIERLKIRIEDSGVLAGSEIVTEYESTRTRDEFLRLQLDDLEVAHTRLVNLVRDLELQMDTQFKQGLGKINEALTTFFVTLFGGGTAQLVLDEEDAAVDEERIAVAPADVGLVLQVQLPRKRVQSLEQLSGGERALTSIALIFAMSQVNPPPFLILDETDAALDEANSKRYAEVLRELGKRTQLIVITHNRASMAAAGALYGVTMGQDGVSRLLSVKLEVRGER